MAENRTLEDKLNNLFKHLAYPGFRVERIAKDEQDTIFVNIKDGSGKRLSLVAQYIPGMTEKQFIAEIKNNLSLKPYNQVIVNNVNAEQNGSLSLENVPESFLITGLPYRQIKISTGSEDTMYVDLCQASYQRVCALMYNSTNFPAIVDFDKLKDCLKRKEVLVLLITLSQ